MLVKDFKESFRGVYSDGFLNSLPEKCLDSRCGAPTEMSDVMTTLCCSNPRCPTKIARRINAITASLGIKDLGNARANDFISKHGISNPLLVFAYEPDSDGEMGNSMSMDVSKKIANQFLEKRAFTLWEYVRLANLPFIQSSALQIFGDYDDLEAAYADIEAGGVEFIRNKLNISKGGKSSATDDEDAGSISVRALKIYNSLMTFKFDLFQALPFVEIIKTHEQGMITLKAVCSDEVGSPFRTKSDFYATVNNLYKNVHVEFLNSVTKSIDFLVWAGADGVSPARVTNKVQKARRYNEQYEEHKSSGSLKNGEHYIQIVTAGEFIKKLEKMQGSSSEE